MAVLAAYASSWTCRRSSNRRPHSLRRIFLGVARGRPSLVSGPFLEFFVFLGAERHSQGNFSRFGSSTRPLLLRKVRRAELRADCLLAARLCLARCFVLFLAHGSSSFPTGCADYYISALHRGAPGTTMRPRI